MCTISCLYVITLVENDEGCTHIGCSGSNGFILVVNRNRLFLFEFRIINRGQSLAHQDRYCREFPGKALPV